MKALALAVLVLSAPAFATPQSPVAASPHSLAYASARATLLGIRYPLLGTTVGGGSIGFSGSGAVYDPIVPTDGNQGITGGLTLTSSLSFTDANVRVRECGTNDLCLDADGATQVTMGSGGFDVAVPIIVTSTEVQGPASGDLNLAANSLYSAAIELTDAAGAGDVALYTTLADFTLEQDGSINVNAAANKNVTIGMSGTGVLSVTGKVVASTQLESTVATGTAPLVVASTTAVTNLNADLLDGVSSASFYQIGSMTDVAIADGGTGQSTATAGFDALAPSTAAGDLIYHNGTDNVRLPAGTGLQFLQMNAGGTAPMWVTSSASAASGDVEGPASSTDLAVPRFDGTTGKLLQDSVLTMGDTGAATLTIGGTSPGIVFTNTSATELNCNGDCNVADNVVSAGTISGTNLASTASLTASDLTFVTPSASEIDCNGTCDSPDSWAISGSLASSSAVTASGQMTHSLSTISAGVRVTGNLSTNVTEIGNVGTGEDDLQTFSLNGNTLNGTILRGVRVEAIGSIANTANAKTLTCYYGAQAVLTHAMAVNVAGNWSLEFSVYRDATDTQKWVTRYEGTTGVAGSLETDMEWGTGAVDDGAAIVFKCTGTATSNNDIVSDVFQISSL